ncbi:MAG: hypothetical protein UV58_C0011G0013 [Candidatus Wolfebacteria bacterium GW2011_GWC1_43_10]|uniref:S23 ribosomal protein n=2 Tax=Candidatus Wolfeibacteriota TaxID=1752735 RepID=A0A0G1CA21_9BACT|nr:MAG: hypothetical protein UV58_C0011G0013 [Candidatus Wolfebacteria bacterium GW2011_GWC1_43_10]KKT22574.1 MAG: hypothetical protein UW08_C0006G0014 [Parcubacteria group bacterium GW2011_GWB1_43_8b]OGM89866.1 MAG: four helix bundle protein [Candidatus Wolfebacteria bacterium GWA1_42_9]
MRRFEEIIAWQKSKELTIDTYDSFKTCKDFSFKDQIQRAALSILNNIAEGFERNTDKELIHFLYIAKGSCGEVRSMLYIALELGYLNKSKFDKMYSKSEEISKIISGFIRKIK